MDMAEHPREQSAPQIGEPAPDFALPDERGQRHALVEELGRGKPVVLFFMRGEW